MAVDDVNARGLSLEQAQDSNHPLPELHLAAYQGSEAEVLRCLAAGHDIHSTVCMVNQSGRMVRSITPLFLAAQKGHLKIVKLLVARGANPEHPAYIEESADLCTPISVARLNLHFLTAHYLKQQAKIRKKHNKLLNEEEARLARMRGDMQLGSEASDGAAGGIQHQVMKDLADLSTWDPTTGQQPQLKKNAAVLMRTVDLKKLPPGSEISADGTTNVAISKSKPVEEVDMDAAQVANDQARVADYLRGADLAQWQPDDHDNDYSSTRNFAPSMSAPYDDLDQDDASLDTARAMYYNGTTSKLVSYGSKELATPGAMVRSTPVRSSGSGKGSGGGGGGRAVPAKTVSPTPPGRNMNVIVNKSAAPSQIPRYSPAGNSRPGSAAPRSGIPSPTKSIPNRGLPSKGSTGGRSNCSSGKLAGAASWLTHGNSDSDDDDYRQDMAVSGSRPATQPAWRNY